MKTPFHILIIEDNPDDRADIRQMLLCGSDVHYRFTEASTGAAGLRACREVGDAAPDLVLLDFYLPDLDGNEMLAELRGNGVLIPFPVVVLTGSATLSGPEMLRAGAQDYIGKSWATPESLTHSIENAVERFRLLNERGQVEARLRSSETRYRCLFEAAKDGMLILDGQTGQITDANPYILGVLGLTRSEALGRELWEIGLFADAIASRAAMAVLQQRGYVRYEDLPLETKTGQRREVEVVANVYQESDQQVIQCNIRDITERKLAEVALAAAFRESADLKAALDEHAIVATTDPQGKITFVNDKFCAISKYPRDELLGQDHRIINSGHHPKSFFLDLWSTIARGHPWHGEIKNKAKDGSYYWVETTIVPFLNKEGKPRQYVAIRADITERKEAEESLRLTAEELARSARAKDDFLATLSHELRTPLTPVLMTATALASDPTLPAEARDQLDMMRRNIELEARLIDDLLDLTRISHGKLTITPVTADIHELLDHTNEIVRSEGLGKRLRIMLQLDAARHHALVDPARLQQVFWNLLRNAVKFTPDGGCITVSTRNDAASRIIISMADNGIGIRAEVLAQIFNAFEQADTTGEHRYGGLGLGLAISSAIVSAHGGGIKAESQGRGHGAEFTVTLGSVPAPAATSDQNTTRDQPAHVLSLLVIEDHEATRTVLERLLTRNGHLVVTAANVHDALAAYKAAHFDAVISDLGLPDGSGIDLMVLIQSIRPVPAIALSGYGMEDDLQRSRQAGFFAHLVKPVNMEQLKQLLSRISVPIGQGCA